MKEDSSSSSSSTAQRCAACAAYGCLLPSDWTILAAAAATGQTGRCHLSLVLSLCTKNNAVAKVRTQSFKTLGDIYATVLPGCYFELENAALRTLLQGMEDTVSSVRCMALFASGNLAQSLNLLDQLPDGLDVGLFSAVAKTSFERLDDRDQKVAANASRSTAYFACITLREDFRTTLEAATASGGDFHVSNFLEQVLQSYVVRLRDLLSLARGNDASQLSWKQRSGIKKQGRAACNSLGLLFQRHAAETMNATDAVACLLDCVEHWRSLEEKTRMAACAALRSLDPQSLSRCVGRGDTTIARSILTCCALACWGSGSRPDSKDLIREFSLLLCHLLTLRGPPRYHIHYSFLQ